MPVLWRALQVKRLPVLAALALAATAVVAWAADLPISLVSLSSPVAPFSDATLEIRTSPGATCAITVSYKSGPSRAKGLVPRVADGRGRTAFEVR